MRFVFALFLFSAFLLPSFAHAQCTMPDGKPDAEAGVIVFNTDHKVMQYCNGDKWIGLRGGGADTLSGLSCSSNEILKWNGGAWGCGIDDAGVPPPVCTGENNALQWDGDFWACVNIAGGGGGGLPDLVNGQHSSDQCTAIGGTVVTEDGQKFCRFNQAACPAGWAAYQNWTTTSAKTCSSYTSCTATGHAWSNQAPKTCTYKGCAVFTGSNCPPSSVYNLQCVATITQIGCY